MSDFLDSELSGPGSNSTDPVMAAINGVEPIDELRFASGIGSGGDSPDIDIEGLISVGEERDSLLVPQNGAGVSSVKDGDKISGKSSEVGKDPLTGDTGDSSVGKADGLSGGNTDGPEIQTRSWWNDVAGNNRRRAYNIGTLDDTESYDESVSRYDRKDFYKFKVKEKTNVNIELDGLSGNADLYLLNNRGKVIEKSKRGGKKAEDIERTLNPGTYYVRVQSRNNRVYANYNLSIEKQQALETIDFMVVYTTEARQAEGGVNAINNKIKEAVADVNTVFENSLVQAELNLVRTAEVNYTESGDYDLDLTRLQNLNDGYMDEVHQLRNLYGADIVSLFVSEPDNSESVGLAEIMGTQPSYEFEAYAFSVIATEYAAGDRHTLAHELGHNLGLRHEDDTKEPTFPYGYGYITPSEERTIMATAEENEGRLPVFSNPDLYLATTGEDLGRENYENSALAINQVLKYATNWRQSKQQPGNATEGTITVLSPNGGESVNPGETLNITWNDNIAENVTISLFKGGSFVGDIAESTKSDGYYSWVVPNNLDSGGDYTLQIESLYDYSAYDNVNFSIANNNSDKYYFTYYYDVGDAYSGFFYDKPGTYYVDDYLSTSSGFYDIWSVESGVGSKNDIGDVYVDSYYDGNYTGDIYEPFWWTYELPAGENGLGSESDDILGFFGYDNFDPYDEADG